MSALRPIGGDGHRTCRFCGEALSLSLVDLGAQPLANSYLTKEALSRPEPRYPLHARVCRACRLVQVGAAVPPEEIFSDYAYFSSVATSWVAHAERYAQVMRDRLGLGPASRVVEVASNDGYLLRHFVAMGIPCLGIEPAANVAAEAQSRGVPTEVAFFGRATAERIRERDGPADLIAANNVFAHVPDLNDFAAGFAALLAPDGTLTLEFPHLLNLLRELQFDTIYHEHYCYFSLAAAERVLAAQGLAVFDVEELPTHGGSLRLFVAHAAAKRAPGPGLEAVRAKEAAAGLDTDAAYAGYAARCASVRDGLLAFLDAMRAEGKRVAAYGAAAKGNTLLNYCGITAEDGRIAYVVDRAPSKQGRYLPGSHIPILAPQAIADEKPDIVLILPWNLRREIAADLAFVAEWGGRFAVAVPRLEVFVPA
ncbi:class I SAM-dependent methyltransferase [Elioraea rosea]|uniref:class I SAM-dependent methyltransferase n=1 Tax=Elioraea rosea TaxID=2492390 RepID=UPI001182CDC5|nr:class I SAM-dependent methyltransferase [Elioraea rosea]